MAPGDHDKYAPLIGKYFGGTNFFPYLLDGGRETFTKNDLWLSQEAVLTPLPGLKITGNFSYNIYNNMYQDVQSKVEIVSQDLKESNPISYGFSGDDWIKNVNDYNRYYVLNTFAEYTFQNLGKHQLMALIGYNQELGNYQSSTAQARSLITPQVPDLSTTTGTQQTVGGRSQVALRGVFYRVAYNYADRYLL
jgi:hypothetical protein